MATASTKIKNVNTGGKRGHNTNQGNPMFMTPAKPVMKKDKKDRSRARKFSSVHLFQIYTYTKIHVYD